MNEIYERLSKPPAEALKTITGGRLNGFTDIKPQWRIQALTDVFGLCGEGWKYSIDRIWSEPGQGGELLAFALVSLQYKRPDGQWSEPVPGIGGSMLVASEKGGLHSSDEGYKMAVTDALSVACKAIGVAAAVYMGEWTGSKYKDDPPPAARVPAKPAAPDPIESRMRKARNDFDAIMVEPFWTEAEKKMADTKMRAIDREGDGRPLYTVKNAEYMETVVKEYDGLRKKKIEEAWGAGDDGK